MFGEDLRPAAEEKAHEDTLFYSKPHHDGRQCGYHVRLDIWIDVTASFREGFALECLRKHQRHF